MHRYRLQIIVAVILLLSLPAGGFVFGFLTCSDCGWNIIGRIFIGFVFAVLTPLTWGFPPRNEGGVGPPFNAWPHIVCTAVVLFVVLYVRERRRARALATTQPNQALERTDSAK